MFIKRDDVFVHRVGTVDEYRDKVEASKVEATEKARPPVRASIRDAVGAPHVPTIREAFCQVS